MRQHEKRLLGCSSAVHTSLACCRYAKQAVSVRLGGVVDKPTAWKQRGRPQLLAVEDPQVRAQHELTLLKPLHRPCLTGTY